MRPLQAQLSVHQLALLRLSEKAHISTLFVPWSSMTIPPWRLTYARTGAGAATSSTRESADDRFPFREVSEVLCYDGLDRTRVDMQVTVYHKVAESHHF